MKLKERLKTAAQNLGGSRPILLGFLGDSVTQGCFELYTPTETSIQTEFRSYEAYHAKLKRILEELYPCVPINILNAGISGDNAPNGRRRLARDILPFGPDLVVVCFGLNDSMSGLEGLDTYGEALDGIFRDLRAAGSEAVFMTPNMMATEVTAETRDPFLRNILEDVARVQNSGILDAYMDRARAVCDANGIPVCDCYQIWKTLASNGVDTTRLLSNRANHPNEAMHWLFANALFQTIML